MHEDPTTPGPEAATSPRHAAKGKRGPRKKRRGSRGSESFSTADLCSFVANHHAAMAIFRAEFDTLSLFITKVAAAAGVDELDGLTLTAWFMAERPKMLERQLLDIGDTDPDLASYLERNLGRFRSQAGPHSILQPPGE